MKLTMLGATFAMLALGAWIALAAMGSWLAILAVAIAALATLVGVRGLVRWQRAS